MYVGCIDLQPDGLPPSALSDYPIGLPARFIELGQGSMNYDLEVIHRGRDGESSTPLLWGGWASFTSEVA